MLLPLLPLVLPLTLLLLLLPLPLVLTCCFSPSAAPARSHLPRSRSPRPSFTPLFCSRPRFVHALVCAHFRPRARPGLRALPPSFMPSSSLTSALVYAFVRPLLGPRSCSRFPSSPPTFPPSLAFISAFVPPYLGLVRTRVHTLVRPRHAAVSCALAFVCAYWPNMCLPGCVCVCVIYIVSICTVILFAYL